MRRLLAIARRAAHRVLVRLGLRIDPEAAGRAFAAGVVRGMDEARARLVREEWAERTDDLAAELRARP